MTTSKDIRDYLHLYLGCEVVINTAQKKKAYLGGIGQFGDAVIIFESLGGRQTHGNYRMESVKPVLRKVETITNDEVKEVAKFLEGGFTEDIDNEPSVHKYFFTPEAVAWYLKKGFDLFGLVESGLAIDKTKLSSKTDG